MKVYQIIYIWTDDIGIYAVLSEHNSIIYKKNFKDEDSIYTLVRLNETKK